MFILTAAATIQPSSSSLLDYSIGKVALFISHFRTRVTDALDAVICEPIPDSTGKSDVQEALTVKDAVDLALLEIC